MSSPRILITNAHSTANAGDHVLLTVTIDELRRVFPASAITVAMNDPATIPGHEDVAILPSLTAYFRRDEGGWKRTALLLLPFTLLRLALFSALYRLTQKPLFALLPVALRPLLDAYTKADLVVSSAGNFLYASGRLNLALLLQFEAIFLALGLGKPTYTMPQTVGPLATEGFAGWWQRAALVRLASQVRILQVRDEPSRKLVHTVRAPMDRTIVAPDVALLFGARPLAACDSHMPPRLGVTLINWGAQNLRFGGQEAYEAAVAEACRWFARELGGEVHLFAQVTGPLVADDDRIPARRVATLLTDLGEQIHLHDTTFGAEELQRRYGEMDIFLGSRLHSTLFALVAGTPVAAIAYQPKTRGVFALLGLERWTLPIEQAQADAVSQLVAALWQEREGVARQIAAALPAAQRQAAAAADRIADDFHNL